MLPRYIFFHILYIYIYIYIIYVHIHMYICMSFHTSIYSTYVVACAYFIGLNDQIQYRNAAHFEAHDKRDADVARKPTCEINVCIQQYCTDSRRDNGSHCMAAQASFEPSAKGSQRIRFKPNSVEPFLTIDNQSIN